MPSPENASSQTRSGLRMYFPSVSMNPKRARDCPPSPAVKATRALPSRNSKRCDVPISPICSPSHCGVMTMAPFVSIYPTFFPTRTDARPSENRPAPSKLRRDDDISHAIHKPVPAVHVYGIQAAVVWLVSLRWLAQPPIGRPTHECNDCQDQSGGSRNRSRTAGTRRRNRSRCCRRRPFRGSRGLAQR